jgi:hypothetical protein
MISEEQLKQIIAEELEELLSEKCWKGYVKKGMKTMFGKRYPNCVKKKKKRKKRRSKRRKNENLGLDIDQIIREELEQVLSEKRKKRKKKKRKPSLRDWFAKSSGKTKSGRRVRGWVQVGGKFDGAPCARQPGQKTVPKCVSSAKRRSMSKKERESAARRKRRKDPGQTRKRGAAKPTYVSTDPKRKRKKKSKKKE